jgi:alpha-1,6-mannosyltransferase
MSDDVPRRGPWMGGRRWIDVGAYVSLAVFLALYVRLFALNDVLANVHAFLVIQMLIYAAYAALAFTLLRGAKIAVGWFVAVAVIAAGLLLLLKTNLSTDVYRYVWDGWVLKFGYNPYLILPTDPRLAPLQSSDLYKILYWKTEFTPYPPVAELVFAGAHAAYAWLGWPAAKLVMALPVVILAAVMYRRVAWYWFGLFILNPLLLFESFNGAHLDAWATVFAFLAYLQFTADRVSLAAGLLALGTLSKIFPAIFLPLFLADLLRRRRHRDAVKFLAVFSAVVGVFYLPFMIESPFPVLRYLSFVRTFQFNALAYGFLSTALQSVAGGDEIALRACAIAFVLVLAFIAVRYRLSVLSLCAAYVFYLLLSTQVYPWYTLFLIPMLFLYFSQSLHPNQVFGLIAVQALLSLVYFIGSPIAWGASPEQKVLAGLVFRGIEVLAVAIVFLWFRGSLGPRAAVDRRLLTDADP